MNEKKMWAGRVSRRRILQAGAGAAASLGLPMWSVGQSPAPPAQPSPPKPGSPAALSAEDDQFLEELEKANFLFFIEQSDPVTGLVKDRCNARTEDKSIVASIAASGFGLTALCIGHKRGYISLADAHQRVLTALHFLYEKMTNHRGFYFHFANIKTGERIWDSEVSSIDTAILLCGVLTCHAYFRHSEISRLARAITSRVEWTWLSEDTRLISLGWSPESGFLSYRWDYYSELMMIYLVGIGSTTHALPADSWAAWKRPAFEYAGIRYIGSFAPLFINQYSQAWFDFRNKRDQYADYYLNSIYATEVHRIFCIELHKDFPDYGDDLWGITASDSVNGYVVWGGPPATGPIDGTIVPSTAGGSLPFLPNATLRVLKNIKERYGTGAWCKYGFVDAFNPLKNWYDTDVIGIDVGITMLMAENLRTSFVWDTFMKNPEAQRGFARAGFKPYTCDYAAEQAKFETRTK